jgi:hypothetical protein
MHLADVHAGLRAQHRLADVGECLDAARAIGAELAVILGANLALGDLDDVAAVADPVAADLGQAGHDVDAGIGIGIGARRIVDAHRHLARRGLELDFAHRHLVGADVDLAAAADRAGGDGKLGAGGDIGHGAHSSLRSEGVPWTRKLPSLRRYQPDQVRRVAADCRLSTARAVPRGCADPRRVGEAGQAGGTELRRSAFARYPGTGARRSPDRLRRERCPSFAPP